MTGPPPRAWTDLFWPGTEVLKNKLGERDPEEFARRERDLTHGRLVQLQISTVIRGRFDLDHLRDVHRHLFQDVYDWAGELRTRQLLARAGPGNILDLGGSAARRPQRDAPVPRRQR
jgi:fido (protein-threonine AMPylation protein)